MAASQLGHNHSKETCVLINQQHLEASLILSGFYLCLWSLSWVHADCFFLGGSGWPACVHMAASPSLPLSLCYYLSAYEVCSDIPPRPQRQRYGGQAARAGAGGVGCCGVQGRANHPLMGNTLFSPSLELPFLLQRGEVAAVQEGTEYPEARHGF